MPIPAELRPPPLLPGFGSIFPPPPPMELGPQTYQMLTFGACLWAPDLYHLTVFALRCFEVDGGSPEQIERGHIGRTRPVMLVRALLADIPSEIPTSEIRPGGLAMRERLIDLRQRLPGLPPLALKATRGRRRSARLQWEYSRHSDGSDGADRPFLDVVQSRAVATRLAEAFLSMQ